MNSTIIQSITPDELSETIRKIIRDELATIRTTDPEMKFLSRDEVCKLLKISLPTLAEYTKLGIIKGCRVGSRILYAESDIQNAVREIPTMKFQRR